MDGYISQKNISRTAKAALLCVLLITALLWGAGCSNWQEDKPENKKMPVTGKFINNLADMKIGMNRMPLPEVNADDVPGINDNQFYIQLGKLQSCYGHIECFLEGSGGYEKEHKELICRLKEFFNEENLDIAAIKELYILPVFNWHCIDKEFFFNSPWLLIYSKDLDGFFTCSIDDYGEGKYVNPNIGRLHPIYREALEENKKKEFCFIANVRYECILDNKNKTIGTGRYDLDIKGDYYKKLQGFGAGISFKKLVSSKNLYKFDI